MTFTDIELPDDREKLEKIEHYRILISAVEQRVGDELTDWESEFVASIQLRCFEQRSLTEKQAAKVEELYERYLG